MKRRYAIVGVSTRYTYNNVGQLKIVTARYPNGDTIAENYAYDSFGSMTPKKSADGTTQAYTYDGNRNIPTDTMTKNNTLQSSTSYTYDKLNRLTRFDNGDNIFTYVYDANSNLRYVMDCTNIGDNTDISYNKVNLPISYDVDAEGGHSYTMFYYLDGNKYMESASLSGTVKTTHITHTDS